MMVALTYPRAALKGHPTIALTAIAKTANYKKGDTQYHPLSSPPLPSTLPFYLSLPTYLSPPLLSCTLPSFHLLTASLPTLTPLLSMNHAPSANMVKYIEKELGRNALEATNMPHPHARNRSIHLATLGPNLCRTALWGQRTRGGAGCKRCELTCRSRTR